LIAARRCGKYCQRQTKNRIRNKSPQQYTDFPAPQTPFDLCPDSRPFALIRG
jgi:hypothetical protein